MGPPSLPHIRQAFYPSLRGAEALATLLLGRANRWGKLPVTMYPANYVNQVSMYSFDMSLAPGRTYRYYTGPVLFPFGFGLSYTTFSHHCTAQTPDDFACTVSNTGARDGDEIVRWVGWGGVRVGQGCIGGWRRGRGDIFNLLAPIQTPHTPYSHHLALLTPPPSQLMVYHRVGKDISSNVTHPVPLRRLVDFERVAVPRGGTATAYFRFTFEDLTLTDAAGQDVVYPGTHYLDFTRGMGPTQTFTIRFDTFRVVRRNAL